MRADAWDPGLFRGSRRTALDRVHSRREEEERGGRREERGLTYLLSRGLTAPGARFSRLEVPRAKLLFFVGVLRVALLEREFNQEEDLGNRFAK